MLIYGNENQISESLFILLYFIFCYIKSLIDFNRYNPVTLASFLSHTRWPKSQITSVSFLICRSFITKNIEEKILSFSKDRSQKLNLKSKLIWEPRRVIVILMPNITISINGNEMSNSEQIVVFHVCYFVNVKHMDDKRLLLLERHTHTHTDIYIYTHIIYIYIYIYMYIKFGRFTKRFVFLKCIYLFCSYIRVCFQLVAFVREYIWHKAMLMGYSVRLELTRVCILNDFQLVMVLCTTHPHFFLECVYFCLLYPSLTFDMFLSFFAYACARWSDFGFHEQLLFVSVWVFVLEIFVCMCGSAVWNLLVIFS